MYGLIGQSLNHSFSKKYFTDKFFKLGIKNTYHNFECQSIDDVKTLLADTKVKGFNVTIPYKETIIPLLHRVDENARTIGAVNTIVKEDGKWVGYNTDAFGFRQMIKPFFESHHERAIILGTGGASKAVQFVLEELGCQVIFISRQPKGSIEFSYDDMNELMLKACPVIVNTTPIGTFPYANQAVDIPYRFITSKHLVIDLLYNPSETLFLKEAKKHGATVLNGLTMLQQQAERSWEIWQSK